MFIVQNEIILSFSLLLSNFIIANAQANSVAALQACLGTRLSNQLVTPTQSFSTDPYYQYAWLKTG